MIGGAAAHRAGRQPFAGFFAFLAFFAGTEALAAFSPARAMMFHAHMAGFSTGASGSAADAALAASLPAATLPGISRPPSPSRAGTEGS